MNSLLSEHITAEYTTFQQYVLTENSKSLLPLTIGWQLSEVKTLKLANGRLSSITMDLEIM
jgi:hypothetical protein